MLPCLENAQGTWSLDRVQGSIGDARHRFKERHLRFQGAPLREALIHLRKLLFFLVAA